MLSQFNSASASSTETLMPLADLTATTFWNVFFFSIFFFNYPSFFTLRVFIKSTTEFVLGFDCVSLILFLSFFLVYSPTRDVFLLLAILTMLFQD